MMYVKAGRQILYLIFDFLKSNFLKFSTLSITGLVFYSLVIGAVESYLTIDPPGPVAVFNTNFQTLGRNNTNRFVHKDYKNSTPVVITCKSSEHYNITWDVEENTYDRGQAIFTKKQKLM